MSRILLLIVTSSCFLGACVEPEDLAVTEDSVTAAGGITTGDVSPGGATSNGISPNGISPNGISPNGISPNGISPNNVKMNGISPNGISAHGTPIHVSKAGAPWSGAGLVGTFWTGHLSDGQTVKLRIDQARQLHGANSDVWTYVISASYDGLWRPLCTDHDDRPIFAVSVRGTWNLAEGVPGGGSYHASATDFTIACRGSAIAKCVEFGYKPWTGRERELASCVRALRADFCGDGTPFTVDGTLVNIYDADGIQGDVAAWSKEAEWSPDGARCIADKRDTRFWRVVHAKPWCFPNTLQPKISCGQRFAGEGSVITELLPQ